MTTLKFADTHNMVAFLFKPAESEGFEQIVDFLNANPIRYALMINSTIYTSCIKQIWVTVKVKSVNREVQLQALVDGKKIIITESPVRTDLQLEDAEGVDCLPNYTIFEQLTLMGGEKQLHPHSLQQPSQLNVQDKGKGKMVEPEPVKKLSKKDQLMLDEELAFKLQAEEEAKERREEWERKERRKQTTKLKLKIEITMSTYLKNMLDTSTIQLKNKKLDEIQNEAEIATREQVQKRAGTELEQESIKKQKKREGELRGGEGKGERRRRRRGHYKTESQALFDYKNAIKKGKKNLLPDNQG
ncbi:hypothetical protein Tco_0992492 [Tanacetum coccineum]|uniref:Xylulose kinase-1 n=1 Tax=Tanacetum coccineum TaxID=301880 RepID=A0ABQ5F2Z8_9ASTR